jgi:DNA-binding ferritin-like protein (Dps family)
MQDIDNILVQTKDQIRPVDAPNHILTRAKAQFENLQEIATPKFIWSTSIVTAILLIFNVYVIGQQSNQDVDGSDLEQYASAMHFNSSNQLYTDE